MTCGNDAAVLAEERKGLCEHVRRLEKPNACLGRTDETVPYEKPKEE